MKIYDKIGFLQYVKMDGQRMSLDFNGFNISIGKKIPT